MKEVFYIMCLLLGAIVLALVLVVFGWSITDKYFGEHVTVECYPGKTLEHIPLEIKPLCIRTEHGR
jgi:hypothetical protein